MRRVSTDKLIVTEVKLRSVEMKSKIILIAATIGLIGLSLPSITYAATDTNAVVEYTDGGITFNPDGNVDNQIPGNLDFGSMKIQTTEKEELPAKTGGETTTGAVSVSDNRANAEGWRVKVNQQAQFQNSNSELLENAVLSISTGTIANNLGNTLSSEGKENQKHQLLLNQDLVVLEAAVQEGLGETSLPLTKFELEIPANSKKSATQYSTTLNWVFSESPEG